MLIAKEEIDALKERHDLAAFIASSGVELRRQGKYLVGQCPFHEDTKGSLVVDSGKRVWNCLGACRSQPKQGGGKGSSGGDLFAFAMKVWGVDFREAYRRLGGEVKDELPPSRPRKGSRSLQAQGRAPRTKVFSSVVAHWQRELTAHSAARSYLESRGLKTPSLWRAFRLGYASGSLAEKVDAEASEVRGLLTSLGLLSQGGRESMEGRVVFPLFAFNQLPVNVYGRAISDELEPQHLYLPGPLRGLFNWNAARRAEEIVLVESVIDALSLIEAGVGQAIALFGANGVIDEHRELVRRFGVRRVVVALDADKAGREAAPQVAARFSDLGVQVDVVAWPEEDPNALLVGRGPGELRKIVEGLLRLPQPQNGSQGQVAAGAANEDASRPARTVSEASSFLTASSPFPEPGGECAQKAVREKEAGAGTDAAVGTSALPWTKLCSDRLELERGDRQWRVAWLPTSSSSQVRATVRLETPRGNFLDGLDLVSAKARESYAKRASRVLVAVSGAGREELGKELGRQIEVDLVELAELGEKRRQGLERGEGARVALSQEERQAGLAFLRSPQLLARIAEDLTAVGYVGESSNKVLGYLVGLSRKLRWPLSMVILSPSGSGKSGLADVVEILTPPEDLVSLSSLTPQALYYMARDQLCRKLLLIEERSGSEAADFSIRALQSKQKLTRAVPIKDPSTGRIETRIFEIFGPAAFLETTTESQIHNENATRCFEVHLDESEEQTMRIHEAQRRSKTRLGLLARPKREAIVGLHHTAQRLLRPVEVVLGFAEALEFPTAWLRTRRDNLRFLHLIEVIAFLHQYQRPLLARQTGQRLKRRLEEIPEEELGEVVVEATLADYAEAYTLAGGLLGETLQDLKKPERGFLEAIRRFVEEKEVGEEGFSRRDLREATGLPQRRVRELFEALLELEYVEAVGSRRGASVRYRLSGEPQAREALPGLLTPEALGRKLEGAERAKPGAHSQTVRNTQSSSNGRRGGESLERENHHHRSPSPSRSVGGGQP